MRDINSLEVSFLVKFLEKALVNSKIQKVKQIAENTFSLELYKPRKHKYLVVSNQMIFLSDKTHEASSLTNLGQILRKRLTNQVIKSIRQHEFDRIIEIETKDYILILELFDKGNLILVNKPDRKIIMASRIKSWKDREIRPKKEYEYPPSRINPFKLTISELKKNLGKKEIVKILAKDFGFGGEIAEKICEKLKIDKNAKKINVLKLYNFMKRIHQEFNELKDINEKLKKEFESESRTETEKEKLKEKFERIREEQERALKKWREKEEEYRKIAKLLYEKYEKVRKQLNSGKREIELEGLTIKLDLKKTVQQNASIYFEKAKKAKKKIEGIKKAMKELEKKMVKEKKKEKVKVKTKAKEWYEKFRWFISSDGFLVVAGKDAKTNEKLIRKYMKDSDLVFHADITGSPFVLIKNPEKKEIPEQTIKEAAEFCGSYSKAWKVGISTVDVYYVKPEQIKKEGGLPTGSFMIYGKRNWIRRIPVRIAIGIKDDEIIYGSEDMVKNKVKNYVIITPNDSPAYGIAKKIQKILKAKIELEKVKKIIPYGRGKLIV